ncbi:hypothetical protein EDB81DRAFT_656213 [Dactylonectria macrodidyma]|uniref:BAH domain-containing protein n=1 Tax=Dactylonectria macrodidyma TaxID=307937 RepID=A0A9P9J1C0_9HYPO|nr:hypothetical protein EDB81DRAFT_656213 [Dactylonectria macrodidyma]
MAAGIQGKWHVANGLVGSPSQEKNGYRQRKRKRSPAGTLKAKAQQSPFSLSGTLAQDELIDYYTVEPRQQWDKMSRYNSFILRNRKFERGDFVLVANETTVKKANNARDSKQTTGESSHFWIAYILEIRAADENRVFARVYWMYWPDELPPGTINGKKSIRGRQLYHGRNELIASNHMDVIDVLSVEGPASVKQWMESSDDEFNSDFFWRQRFNCHQKRLTSAQPICRCKLPANPHRRTIGCSICGMWFHEWCLIRDTLERLRNTLQDSEGTLPGKWTRVDGSNCQGDLTCSDAETDGQEALAMMSKGMDILEAIVSRSLAQLLEPGREDKPTETVAREPNPYRTLPSPFEATLKLDKGTVVVEIKNSGKEGAWSTFLAEVHCSGCGGPMR